MQLGEPLSETVTHVPKSVLGLQAQPLRQVGKAQIWVTPVKGLTEPVTALWDGQQRKRCGAVVEDAFKVPVGLEAHMAEQLPSRRNRDVVYQQLSADFQRPDGVVPVDHR